MACFTVAFGLLLAAAHAAAYERLDLVTPGASWPLELLARDVDPFFVPPIAINPSVRSYGFGSLRPSNRDDRSFLDTIGSKGTFGWGAYRPSYYDASDRKVHPWSTAETGLLPWADSLHGYGLHSNWRVSRAVVDASGGDAEQLYSPDELWTNSQVNPLAADPLLPGGQSALLAGGNPHGVYGIGSLNLRSPVGLAVLGTGAGTGVAWLRDTAGGPLPYVGYGPQGKGGLGSGTPLTEHPIFRTMPGLYHPPASNVFF